MSPCAAHIYQHDSSVAFFEVFGNAFLKREEIKPPHTAITLTCHPEVEVVEGLRVFREPLKDAVLGVKTFLERTILGVCGVLIFRFGEERRKSHSGCSNDVISVIDAGFKLGDDQISCDIVCYVKINASLTNGVYGDEVSKEAEE